MLLPEFLVALAEASAFAQGDRTQTKVCGYGAEEMVGAAKKRQSGGKPPQSKGGGATGWQPGRSPYRGGGVSL
jgi:hypothetical protein